MDPALLPISANDLSTTQNRFLTIWGFDIQLRISVEQGFIDLQLRVGCLVKYCT